MYVDLSAGASVSSLQEKSEGDVVVAVELGPTRALDAIAARREGSPHVGFVLDVSGSMIEDMESVIVAAKSIVPSFKRGDHVSIVHFSDDAFVVADRLDGAAHVALREAVDKVAQAENRLTYMAKGLEKMHRLLASDGARPRSVVLFTDGHPHDEEAARTWAKTYGEQGITLHVLGFGDELSLNYAEELATLGRGQTIHVRDVGALAGQMSAAATDAQQIGITNARLRLEFAPQFVPTKLYRGRPQFQLLGKLDANQRPVDIIVGNVAAGSDFQSFFIEGRFDASQRQAGGPLQRVADIALTYDVPSVPGARGLGASVHLDLPVEASCRPNLKVKNAFAFATVKGLENEFQHLCMAEKFAEAVAMAAMIIAEYEKLGTAEGAAGITLFRQVIEQLGLANVTLQEIQATLNRITATSSTNASRERATTSSRTQAARPGGATQGRLG